MTQFSNIALVEWIHISSYPSIGIVSESVAAAGKIHTGARTYENFSKNNVTHQLVIILHLASLRTAGDLIITIKFYPASQYNRWML